MKDSAFVSVWVIGRVNNRGVGWGGLQTGSDVDDVNVWASRVEGAKWKSVSRAIFPNPGKGATSCVVDDGRARPDIRLYESPNALLDVQLVVNEADGHHALGLYPTVAGDISRAGRLQLANDASWMGSVEASPCRPGRHWRRREEGQVDGAARANGGVGAGVAVGVGRILRSLRLECQSVSCMGPDRLGATVGDRQSATVAQSLRGPAGDSPVAAWSADAPSIALAISLLLTARALFLFPIVLDTCPALRVVDELPLVLQALPVLLR